MIVGQPAEERVAGARAMLADGLFRKFPKPDQALAVHVDGAAAAGTVSYVSGPALANTNRADITIHGRGGHIGSPHTTVDPIVIAARTILALQTVVTRETDPRDTALVAVGSIHGGTAANLTPDDVTLSVSVRSHRAAVQEHLLEALRRVVIAEAAAARAPKPPTIVIDPGVRSVDNDPKLVARLLPVIKAALGADNVQPGQAAMAGDDFAEFGHSGVPSVLLLLGATEPQKFAAFQGE
jgi:amidohydrolase